MIQIRLTGLSKNVTFDQIHEACKAFVPSNICIHYTGGNTCSATLNLQKTCANLVMIRIGDKFATIIPGTLEFTTLADPAPKASPQQAGPQSSASADNDKRLVTWALIHCFCLIIALWIIAKGNEGIIVTAIVGLLMIFAGLVIFMVADHYNYKMMLARANKDSELQWTMFSFFFVEVLITFIATLLSL